MRVFPSSDARRRGLTSRRRRGPRPPPPGLIAPIDRTNASRQGGSNADIPHSLAYNETWGQVALLGTTGSVDFPTTTGSFQPDFNVGGAVTISIYGNDVQSAGLDCYLLTLDGTDYTAPCEQWENGAAHNKDMAGVLVPNFNRGITAAQRVEDIVIVRLSQRMRRRVDDNRQSSFVTEKWHCSRHAMDYLDVYLMKDEG